MARRTGTFDVAIPIGGVRRDLDPNTLPPTVLREGENWLFRDGVFRVRPGFSALADDINERTMGYLQYRHQDAALRTVKGTTVGWRKMNATGTAWDNITGTALSGAITDHQVFRVFDKGGVKWLLGINGANTMKKWDGATATYVDVGGTPPRARAMAIAFDRVLLGNLLSGATISAQAIDVCANKDFDTGWGTILTLILADTPGEIVAMQELGNLQTAIYLSDAIHVAIAQGGLVPFRFELKAAGIAGPASAKTLVAISDALHVWLANDGSLMQFDGVSATPLPNSIQRHVLRTADRTRLGLAHGVFDAERGELWFFYPEVGASGPNIGIMVSFPSYALWPFRVSTLRFSAAAKLAIAASITIGELTGTIGSQSGTIGDYASVSFRKLVAADIDGQDYTDLGVTDAGAAITSFFETGLIGNGHFGTLHELDHRFQNPGVSQNVTVKIGRSDYGETRVLSAGETIDIGDPGDNITGHRETSKRFSVRVEANSNQEVIWQGAKASYSNRGLR